MLAKIVIPIKKNQSNKSLQDNSQPHSRLMSPSKGNLKVNSSVNLPSIAPDASAAAQASQSFVGTLPFTTAEEGRSPHLGRKVAIRETVFEFGDDMNDLNQLEMQVSFQEIELKVRFSSHEQLLKWKEGIMEALGKGQSPPRTNEKSNEVKVNQRSRTDTLVLKMPVDKSKIGQKPSQVTHSGPKT